MRATTNVICVQVLRADSDGQPFGRPCVATIGAYDGVHLGHRAVIGEVRRRAADRGCASVVVTFDRHPAEIVRPQSAPLLLTDLAQKLELLASTGVDATLVVPFDAERAAEAAEQFVHEILVERISAVAVVVGEDFHFGKGRRGNVSLLRDMGLFEVVGLGLVGQGDVGDPAGSGVSRGSVTREMKVSSTAVRALLRAGDLAAANDLLGRHHEVRGTVEHGDKRGRELGFPTANVSVPAEICLPGDGIYAAWYERPDGTSYPAAVSLGRRPTFYEAQAKSLLEACLLDWSGDLYGEAARVRFVARLRGEERFESVADLVAQMGRDVEQARAVLATTPTYERAG